MLQGLSGSSSGNRASGKGNEGALPKSLSSKALQVVVISLGLTPSQIVSVRERPGGDLELLKETQTLKDVGMNTSETLKALGLVNAEAVISLQVADDIELIKKRMKDISKSLLKKEDFAKLAALMGFDEELEGLILIASDGGLQLVEKSLEELEGSL
jgi:hypothetical protein